jgi:hypothetical protein
MDSALFPRRVSIRFSISIDFTYRFAIYSAAALSYYSA